jgi:hypothetical protein
LESAIIKIQEDQVGLKLSGTYQILACADNVYLLRYHKRSTEALIYANTDFGTEANAEEMK